MRRKSPAFQNRNKLLHLPLKIPIASIFRQPHKLSLSLRERVGVREPVLI